MTAGNGNVRIRRFPLVIQIEISDPDGILNYWIFAGNGVRGPLEANAIGLDCPVLVQIPFRRGIHQAHQHTVIYDDCQENQFGGSTERWVLPLPTPEWQDGERVGTMGPKKETGGKTVKAPRRKRNTRPS